MPRILALFLAAVVAIAVLPLPASAEEFVPGPDSPGGSFYDDDGSIHEPAIEALAVEGITSGCGEQRYCPYEPVTRGQMAAFLRRAFAIPPSDTDAFVDDDDSIFEGDINALAAAGITRGCEEPFSYCPDRSVSRGEMAALLVRTLDLPASDDDAFTDDDDSIFEGDINALAAARLTSGCDDGRYCPTEPVLRSQIASFLLRARGDLTRIEPPPRPQPEFLERFTTYHPCCQPRVTNIHLIADTLDGVVLLPGETLSVNEFVGPRTAAKGYVEAGALINSQPATAIGGGISQFATTLFNAVFRGGLEIVDHRPHTRYFSRYPWGIEATLSYGTIDLAFRNDTWTPVTIDTSYTSTSITVTLYGNTDGRQVSWDRVCYDCPGSTPTYSGGGAVRYSRTITEPGGEPETEVWYWTYVAG